LALPRPLLESWIVDTVDQLEPGALRDTVIQLRNRPTFQEQWPQTWQQQMHLGKKRMLHIENIRKDKFTLDMILEQNKEIHEWWRGL